MPISIIIFGLCILASSFVISYSIQSRNEIMKTNLINQSKYEKKLLTQSELADYLGVPEADVSRLIARMNLNKEQNGVIGINMIKINDTYYFPKQGVDEWLKSGQGNFTITIE